MSSPAPTTATDRLGFKPEVTCALGVRDYEGAKSWYQDVLGFSLVYELADYGWCELTTPVPGVTVGLSQVEQLELKGGATLTWGVSSVDAARAELERQGVRFDGESRDIEGVVRLATFFDPDGNAFMLAESLAPNA